MKKTLLFLLAATMLVGCNSFKKSEWAWLEDEIRSKVTMDFALDAVYDNVDDETYSSNYLQNALTGKLGFGDALKEDKTGLATLLVLGVGSSNETWETAFDNLDDYIDENDYDRHTIHDLPDDVGEDDLGYFCKTLAQDVVKYFDEYYSECSLSYPQYIGKEGQRKYYAFYCSLNDTEYTLYDAGDSWRWGERE